MDPISLPSASQRPETSVLTLDQDGSWKAELTKAMHLLGLPPYPLHFPKQTWAQYRFEVEHRSVVRDPRVEYISRWLLGKLEPKGTQATQESKITQTWYLLAQLLPKCSSAAIARLLKTHSLPRIIESTFLWLEDVLVAQLLDPNLECEDDVVKRAFNQPISSHAALRYQYLGLVGRILGLLQHIQREETSNAFEASHRRHITLSLKAEPSQLAQSIGSVFYVCNQILQANAGGTVRSVTELSTTTFLSLFVDIFELQYKWSSESTKAAIDDAFISSAAVPTLQLLDTCQHWLVSQFHDEIKQLSDRLRTLLTVHTILPIRATLNSANDSVELTMFDSLTCSLSARPLCAIARMQTPRAAQRTTAYLQTSFLSQLYGLAIESCRKRSSKVGQADVSWLESLLIKLSGIAGILLPPESPFDAQNCHKRLLTRMLNAAIEARVTLSVSLLQSILGKNSGIFDVGVKNSAGRQLVNKCLSVDADVFVLPSTSSDPSSYDYRPPNLYLKKLLAELTKHESLDQEEKDQIRDLILLPLLDGFIRARDLPGFLGLWEEQLDDVELRRKIIGTCPGTISPISLWEDEALLSAVATHVDSFTISQVRKIVAKLSDEPTKPRGLPPCPKITTLSSAVILYCVYRGISGHDKLGKLRDLAGSTFVSLQTKLNTPEKSPSSLRWRYWRIMTAIVQRWQSHVIDVGLPAVIEEALNVVKRAPSWSENDDGHREDLTQIYHAFCFIASTPTHDGVCAYPATKSGNPLNIAFEMVMRTMEPFHLQVKHDMFETFKPRRYHPNSFSSMVYILSVEQLYLGCMYTVLRSRGLFSKIDIELQSIFIEQAYTCALQQRRTQAACQPNDINFGWLWQYLLTNSVVANDSVLQECLRAFLITQYATTSQFNDPNCWKIKGADYTLAFEAINTLQADDLGRNERANVSNSVLNILTHASIPERCYIVSHLCLQEKMISLPSKLMCLLNNLELPSRRVGAPTYRERSALLEIAQKIDDFESTPSGALVWAISLRRLCRSVVKFLVSTVEQRDSLQHLRVLYDELVRTLECHFEDKSSCPLAFSVAAAAILNVFHEHETQISAVLQVDTSDLQRPRQYHLEVLLRAARDLLRKAESLAIYQQEGPSFRIVQILDDLCPYADLIRLHPNLGYEDEIFGKLQSLAIPRQDQSVERFVEKPSAVEIERIDRLALRVARLNLQISAGDDGLATFLAQCSSMLNQKTKEEIQTDHNLTGKQPVPPLCNAAKEELVSYMQEAVVSMNPTQKADALQMTSRHLGKHRSKIGDLYLLKAISTSLNDDDVSELQPTAAQCCISLCTMLLEAESDLERCILPMQCIAALMQKQPRMVRHSQIDALISGIAVAARNIELRQTLRHSGMLFTGLCRLFTTVLRSHRSKVGGRYNLIVPALQGLLRCLFTPYARASTESEPRSTFSDVHAAEYARILTMLCDPTVSAVTKPRKRSHAELNDKTKKARSIAGQHLPALVMEYCRCQLSGKIERDMGAALRVGLWGILEVMTQDRIKAMNAAMDFNSRSVFRSLYDDFKKSGRWSGG